MGMMQLGHLLVIMCFMVDAFSFLGSAVSVTRSTGSLPKKPTTIDPIGPAQQPSIQPDPAFSPKQAPASSGRKRHGIFRSVPRKKASHISGFEDESPPKEPIRPSSIALVPSASSFGGPVFSPPVSSHKRPHHPGRRHASIPKPSHHIPPIYNNGGPSSSSFHSLPPSSMRWDSHAPAPSPGSHFNMFIHPPAMSPLSSSLKKLKSPPPSQVLSLPPPPPNSDCTSVTCTEPLTYTPPGLPCGCVWPIQVKLRFSVPIYTFFTLVTELAEEIAASISLNSSQVRIMGANAATQQLEKSTVLINLVPRGVKFSNTTAYSIYKKFWGRQVFIKPSLFGAYDLLFVRYPGLPPSPPSPVSISATDDGPYAGNVSDGRMNKPLGVDVPRRKKDGLSRSMIVVIVFSSFTALVACLTVIWLFLLKCGNRAHKPSQVQQDLVPKEEPAGTTGPATFGNIPSSSSMSLSSAALTYTGSAKTFTLNDIEGATNNFDDSRILGEGGFGVVYSGKLDDGKEVAVKVLKRYDQHGSREFLAEVEMLSRLHHRNLVKLIGICTEGHIRCLVYELIPNGSVESHLHGAHKETDPLDWDARMKIALGAARGLAYLHEDSSPRVIHRDFKSSNILLEHDFTPKVSDFGLARAAIDEGNKHISTHVMGTFGTEGLETIIDPEMKSTVPFDTLTKVAAIASMCVQPEVSHRPFMGEVVQALKLVCNEFDEAKVQDSTTGGNHENLLIAEDSKTGTVSGEIMGVLQSDLQVTSTTSGLLSASMGFERQESGSIRRHSSSGPLNTGRRKHFWQRLRSLSSGSVSDNGLHSNYDHKPANEVLPTQLVLSMNMTQNSL
ncbi:hypothetical protein Tsubulata_022790 [Turnera subulata]|uniref:Protein kinase domain-containing protein n=1 Tax=Turnera subulata TaxID=218843 RepID=A0A9Q0F646_9ROSI|nr:hypothetical protein Tsubulata_022790 [Turnera subulata]